MEDLLIKKKKKDGGRREYMHTGRRKKSKSAKHVNILKKSASDHGNCRCIKGEDISQLCSNKH